jgi:hypothetical protein
MSLDTRQGQRPIHHNDPSSPSARSRPESAATGPSAPGPRNDVIGPFMSH